MNLPQLFANVSKSLFGFWIYFIIRIVFVIFGVPDKDSLIGSVLYLWNIIAIIMFALTIISLPCLNVETKYHSNPIYKKLGMFIGAFIYLIVLILFPVI